MPGVQRMRIHPINSHLPLVMATETNLTQNSHRKYKYNNSSSVMSWFGCNALLFLHHHGFMPLPSLSQACWKPTDAHKLHHTAQTKGDFKGIKKKEVGMGEVISSLQLQIQRMFLSAAKKQNLSSACLRVVSTNALGPRALNPFRPCRFFGEINETFHHGTVITVITHSQYTGYVITHSQRFDH